MIEESGRHPGRRSSDPQGGEFTFPVAIGKGAVWMLGTMLAVTGSLLAWLCLGQMEQGKMLVRMEERSQAAAEQTKVFHQELERLTLTDNRLSLEMKHMQILAAQHGWKERPNE